MSTITVRLFHHPTRTPIAELQGVDPGATLSSLRAMAERHLAAEEACMMRVFDKWHVEVQLGARKAVVELTAQDEAASLSSLGIEDYSAVLLEGPLTGDFEGVGQGLALVAAQVREHNSQLKAVMMRITEGMSGMSAGISEIVAMQRLSSQISSLPNIGHTARLAVAAEEQCAFALLSLQKSAVVGYIAVVGEEAKAWETLLAASRSDYQRFLRLAIDTTTPQPGVVLVDPHTAVKAGNGDNRVTLRSSQPITEGNHRWGVRIHEVGSYLYIKLGLLPKLSADKENKMGGTYLDDLGGWCICQGATGGSVHGKWQCEPLPIAKGDLVLFDYSFTNKTLTIRCGGKQVVGRIPNAGEELYPAFTLGYAGEKVVHHNKIMEKFLNAESVLGPNNQKVNTATLNQKDYILLYFSASWCPPCRAFTPQLVDFYNKHKANKNFEIVFCSWDNNPQEFSNYFQKMPWLAMPKGPHVDYLGRKYNVRSIPTLIVLDAKTQEVVNTDGRMAVVKDPTAENFPWKGQAFSGSSSVGGLPISPMTGLMLLGVLLYFTFRS